LYSFTHYGYGLTFGIQVAPIKRLLLGAGYSPEVRLHTTINLQYSGSSSTATRYDDTTYPASWSAGATAFLNTTCMWGLEISGQHWSRLLYGQRPVPSLRNTLSFATGAEFYSLKDPMIPYWKKMAYRVGFVHRPFFSLDSDGGRIQEWWVAWGLGLPMSAGISQIDVSFGYGKRGSIGDNGFSEDLWKGALTVTVGEKWFTKGRR